MRSKPILDVRRDSDFLPRKKSRRAIFDDIDDEEPFSLKISRSLVPVQDVSVTVHERVSRAPLLVELVHSPPTSPVRPKMSRCSITMDSL